MLSKHDHLITNLTSFDNEERIFLLHLNMMKSCLRLMVNITFSATQMLSTD